MKRWRTVAAKAGQLLVRYGRLDGDSDLIFAWGDGTRKADGICVMDAIMRAPVLDDKPLVKILIERGYDITTLRFSIQKRTQDDDLQVGE